MKASKKAEYMRAWFAAHPGYYRAWYARRRERLLARQRERYAQLTPERREALKRHRREWRRANREQINAKTTAWRLANPEKQKALASRRNAAARHARVRDLTHEQWAQIRAAHDYRCAYCGGKPEKLTQDHVIPLSKGGLHTASNIVPACQSCNSSKGAREKPAWAA